MARQSHDGRRINVQRKTINNWRNNRSTPRSLSDPQFLLVMAALEPTDEEWRALEATFSSGTRSNTSDAAEPPVTSRTLLSRHWVMAGFATLCVTAIVFMLILRDSGRNAAYFETIPDGALTLSGEGFVLPESASRPLTAEELGKLSDWELYVARNEIYARKGWQFVQRSSVCLQNHFDALKRSSSGGWYVAKPERAELTNLEAANAAAIRQHECATQGGQLRCDGNLHACQ